jgi:guanylate kinase
LELDSGCKYGMHVLLGESSSGKSTAEKRLNLLGVESIKQTTTRPKRDYEVDGVDYHFVTDEEFEWMVHEGDVICHRDFNGWHYGFDLNCINYKSKDYLLVTEPSGYRCLNDKIRKENLFTYYLKIDERLRMKRLLERGDSVDEIIRRIKADRMDFFGIEGEVDHIITEIEIDEVVQKLYNLIVCKN